MADRRQMSAANAILVTLSSLAAAFQLCGLNLTYLILEKRRLQMVGFQIANQYDIAVARLRTLRFQTMTQSWLVILPKCLSKNRNALSQCAHSRFVSFC